MEQQTRKVEEEMETTAGEVGNEMRRPAEEQERRVERHLRTQEEEIPQRGGKRGRWAEGSGGITGCRLRQSDYRSGPKRINFKRQRTEGS